MGIMRRKSKHAIEVEKLQNRELTFFIGAGVSKLSGVPTWSEVVGNLDTKLRGRKKKNYSSEELISIPEKFYLSQKVNQEDYFSTIKSILDFESRVPNKVHDRILLMNPRRIVTTNFDDLIEKSVTQRLLSFKKICSDEQVSSIDSGPYILKVHGDFSKNNIVFRENDYLRYEDDFRLISNLLRTIFATDTVVFIGYGLNDYNIKLILDWAKRILGNEFICPYFIYTDKKQLSKSDIEYQSARGLRLIDSNKFKGHNIEWIDRYLNSIEFLEQEKATGNNTQFQEPGSIDFLYNKLKKLNEFPALRTIDIVFELKPYVTSEEVGILEQRGKLDIFSGYFEYKDSEPKSYNTKLSQKINIIDRILGKTSVEIYNAIGEMKVFSNKNQKRVNTLVSKFDLYGMDEYIESSKDDSDYIFRSAYYLAKLGDYHKSVQCFNKIAKDSYLLGNYLKQYFSQINIGYLRLFGNFDHNWSDEFFKKMGEDYFKILPISFQNNYNFISGYDTTQTFFSNAFKIVSRVNKIESDTNTKVTTLGRPREIGLKLSAFELLNFSHQNMIIDDEYSEYSEVIKYIYSAIINIENSESIKWILSMDFDSFFHVDNNITPLNDFDIFCIINYFDYKDLGNLVSRLDFNDFVFQDMSSFETMIRNLINPLKDSEFLIKYPEVKTRYKRKLKTIVLLLSNTNINQDFLIYFLDKMLDLSLNSLLELSEIYSLLDEQKRRGNISEYVISGRLVEYIDTVLEYELLIKEQGKLLEQYSESNFDYFDFAGLVSLELCANSILEKVNINILKLIQNSDDLGSVVRVCKLSEILNEETTFVIVENLTKRIQESGDLRAFESLIILDTKKARKYISLIETKMRIYVESEKTRVLNKSVLPRDIRYRELTRLCGNMFINSLEFIDTECFINLSNEIDFYLNPIDFNYEKFDIKWLYKLGYHGITRLSALPNVKNTMNILMKEFITNTKLSDGEKASLVKIYFKFFA